jgi:hypothetical protein
MGAACAAATGFFLGFAPFCAIAGAIKPKPKMANANL